MVALPPPLLKTFNEWIKDFDEQREIVLQELEKVELSLKIEELELQLVQKSSLDQEKIFLLINSIIGLFLNYYKSDLSIDEFVEEVTKDETLKSGIKDEEKIKQNL